MRTLIGTLVMVISLVASVPSAHAQTSHAAPQSALDAAVQRHLSGVAADRELVQRVLDHPQVKAVADQAGLSVRDAKDAVATLSGEELRQIASHASQVEEALAGGQSRVVISTTLIIIALLVLILIIVAVD